MNLFISTKKENIKINGVYKQLSNLCALNMFTIEQIVFMEADRKYTIVYGPNANNFRICFHLKKIFSEVSKISGFIRVHRSYVINNAYVEKKSDDNLRVYLKNGYVIPLSFEVNNLVKNINK